MSNFEKIKLPHGYPVTDGGSIVQKTILLLIIFQSIGIRILPLQGVSLCAIMCLIMFPKALLPVRMIFPAMFFTMAFIGLSIPGMTDLKPIVYLLLVIFAALLFANFIKRWETVEIDLLEISWWICLHGLVSFLAYKIEPAFFSNINLMGMQYYICGPLILSGFEPCRATGICWEPGLLQYLANLSLFLGIKHSSPRWKLSVSFLTLVVTFSTAGILALIAIILYWFFIHRKSMAQTICLLVTTVVVALLFSTVFLENVTGKFSGENTSGLTRMRDIQIGWELIKERPLLGHGQFDENYLTAHTTISKIEANIFSKEYINESGEMTGGYTNGFLAVFAGYGIPLGCIFYWCFFNNRLIQGGFKEHLVFFLISVITFISEPITHTSWFFVLVISGILYGLVPTRLSPRCLQAYSKG